jgi:hemolysin III
MKNSSSYSLKEEIISSIIHGIGIFLSIAILSVLVTLSAVYGNTYSIVSTAIFGFSMLLMYSASTLYHAIPFERTKKILKKFDHIAIYYLIAGTYTPFLLVVMRNALGWTIFGIIWGLALLGTALKIILTSNGKKVWSIGLYLIMGWLVVIASKTLFTLMPKIAVVFLIF